LLQVRRNPLPAPATPRVHDAVLRIGTLLGVHTVTTISVRDEVRSASLEVSASARAFGFSLPGESRTLPLRITNTGNALAFLKASGPFQVLLPMPLAPGASADALVRYAPTATTSAMPVSGPVAISAVDGCQAPQALTFQGGIGPYAEVLDTRRFSARALPGAVAHECHPRRPEPRPPAAAHRVMGVARPHTRHLRAVLDRLDVLAQARAERRVVAFRPLPEGTASAGRASTGPA